MLGVENVIFEMDLKVVVDQVLEKTLIGSFIFKACCDILNLSRKL